MFCEFILTGRCSLLHQGRYTRGACSWNRFAPGACSLNFSRLFPLPHSGLREETAEIQTMDSVWSLLPHIKPVWYEGAKLGKKSFVAQHILSLENVGADMEALLWERVAGACHGSKLPRVYRPSQMNETHSDKHILICLNVAYSLNGEFVTRRVHAPVSQLLVMIVWQGSSPCTSHPPLKRISSIY